MRRPPVRLLKAPQMGRLSGRLSFQQQKSFHAGLVPERQRKPASWVHLADGEMDASSLARYQIDEVHLG